MDKTIGKYIEDSLSDLKNKYSGDMKKRFDIYLRELSERFYNDFCDRMQELKYFVETQSTKDGINITISIKRD